jgi:hypothetical protein
MNKDDFVVGRGSGDDPLIFRPRLISKAHAAEYCSLTNRGFTGWVRRGVLPPALPGTARWDLKALDARLDQLSGLTPSEADDDDTFARWMEGRRRAG